MKEDEFLRLQALYMAKIEELELKVHLLTLVLLAKLFSCIWEIVANQPLIDQWSWMNFKGQCFGYWLPLRYSILMDTILCLKKTLVYCSFGNVGQGTIFCTVSQSDLQGSFYCKWGNDLHLVCIAVCCHAHLVNHSTITRCRKWLTHSLVQLTLGLGFCQ